MVPFPSDYCKTILKDFPDGVLILDRERIILYANPALFRLLDLDPGKELAGRHCYDIAKTAVCKTLVPHAPCRGRRPYDRPAPQHLLRMSGRGAPLHDPPNLRPGGGEPG